MNTVPTRLYRTVPIVFFQEKIFLSGERLLNIKKYKSKCSKIAYHGTKIKNIVFYSSFFRLFLFYILIHGWECISRRRQARVRYGTMRDELLEEDEHPAGGHGGHAEEAFSEIMINQVCFSTVSKLNMQDILIQQLPRQF